MCRWAVSALLTAQVSAAAPAVLDRPLQHYSQNHEVDESECIFPLCHLRASASDQSSDNKLSGFIIGTIVSSFPGLVNSRPMYRILPLGSTPAFWATRASGALDFFYFPLSK
jgi:hypothetical protein